MEYACKHEDLVTSKFWDDIDVDQLASLDDVSDDEYI